MIATMTTPKKAPACLVTGASRGIGREIALQLAARGARVGVHYNENRAAADAVLAALPGKGHAAFRADMSDPGAVERLWNEAVGHFGAVGVVVNNAAAHREHPPLSTGYAAWRDAWEKIIRTNLQGPANLCYLAARAMAESGGGRIVNISSRGAFRGEPEAPAYGASKAGINSLSQSLAKALAPVGVLVYCIAPGWVETEMAAEILAGPRGAEIRSQHPLGRVTRAEEIARTVVFCALDAPAAMTGSVIDVNGASYLRT
jgi:3-oxoacyl-[acyl-carrier protein] reductase